MIPGMQPIDPLARLEALYAELPTIECKRLCRDCCGPVVQAGAMTALEYARIADVPASSLDPKDFMACSLLDGEAGTCRVYDRRPLICRLFGVAEGMLCTYGCAPERVLTRAEAYEFMTRAEAIGGRIGG